MKLIRLAALISSLGLLFVACEPFLLYEDQMPTFKAPSDKALCVVIRPSGMYGNFAQLWLDKKTVGGTEGNTITSFEVEPGEHLVITRISIKTKVKLNFEAGKVYYLMQAAFPIPMIGVSTSLTPMPCAEAVAKLEEEKGKLKFTKLNPNNTDLDDLEDKDVKEEMEDWKKWADDNQDKAKVEREYSGC
jgi:hypothetical protein